MLPGRLLLTLAVLTAAVGESAAQGEPVEEPAPAPAPEPAPEPEPEIEESPPIQIHGFISQGFLLTGSNNYLAHTTRGSFEFTEGGITIQKQINDRLSAGVQLFARDLGPIGNYNAKFDWFNLDYRWRDWLGIRAGRVKVPYGFYNETSDIDAAQPVALLPQSFYPTTNRDILLAQTGVELYGYHALGEAGGALAYRAFAGTIHIDRPTVPGLTLVDFYVPYVYGGRLQWETPLEGLRLGGGWLQAFFDYRVSVTGAPAQVYDAEQEIHIWYASAEYLSGPYQLVAEYARWYATAETNIPMLPSDAVKQDRGYAMAGYRWAPWLQTTAYYSILYPDTQKREGREDRQHDAAIAARFDLTPNWLLKLEAHYLRGTAALDAGLNEGVPPAMLDNQWWMLAAKTTAFF